MFTKDLIERAVKTFAQAALASFAAGVAGLDYGSSAAWKVVGIAAVSAGISALTSLLSKGIGPDKNSPSIV